MKKLLVVICFLIAAVSFAQNCQAVGDTQGYIDTVKVRLDSGGTTIRVFFSDVQNDRWGCVASPGYVEVTTRSSYVSATALAMIYDSLMVAKENLKAVGIDSPSDNPCYQGNTVWVIWE